MTEITYRGQRVKWLAFEGEADSISMRLDLEDGTSVILFDLKDVWNEGREKEAGGLGSVAGAVFIPDNSMVETPLDEKPPEGGRLISRTILEQR